MHLKATTNSGKGGIVVGGLEIFWCIRIVAGHVLIPPLL